VILYPSCTIARAISWTPIPSLNTKLATNVYDDDVEAFLEEGGWARTNAKTREKGGNCVLAEARDDCPSDWWTLLVHVLVVVWNKESASYS
jgi:hypothetical protein